MFSCQEEKEEKNVSSIAKLFNYAWKQDALLSTGKKKEKKMCNPECFFVRGGKCAIQIGKINRRKSTFLGVAVLSGLLFRFKTTFPGFEIASGKLFMGQIQRTEQTNFRD